MPTYYDSKGIAYTLAEEIGRGGEGTVYFCADDPELVAKIYYEPVTDEKAEKLRWMAANKNERLLKVSAWVIDVLYEDEAKQKAVGFLMPNVKAKEIHELYSLKSRRVYFPDATWHFLVHTAANVARSFYNLHKYEHVMGDVNHGNCVVLADGTVKLIDCDSYSIKTDEMRYICEVGVATHLAPELHGKNLRDVERKKEHDNFGLAVIVFQLLFLGRHPFSGNVLGEKDKSLEECIREYRFAYSKNAKAKDIKRPPGTLSLAGISPKIAKFFERAFLENEKRPNPREWVEALEDLANNLEQCSLHPGHHFYEKLKACPWCRIESQTGLMLFPFITTASNRNGEKPFNIFTIESLINSLGVSQNLPATLRKPAAIMPSFPTPEVVKTQTEFRIHQLLIVGAQFAAVVVLLAIFGVGASCFFGLILMLFFIVHLNNYDKSIADEVRERFGNAQSEWDNLATEWDQGAMSTKLNDNLAQIKTKIGDYKQFQRKEINDLKLLQEESARQSLDRHLRSHRLAETKIFGLKEEHKKLLIECGIRTAAEVEEKRLRHFHNISDDYLVARLLDWRKNLEKDFASEKAAEILETERTKFFQKVASKRRGIEREIELLLGPLHSGSHLLKRKQKQLLAKSEEISNVLVQAEVDLKTLGSNMTAIIALIAITFFTPFVMAAFMNDSFVTNRAARYDTDDSPTSGGSDTSGRLLYDDPPELPRATFDLPDENITDREIAELPDSKRYEYAENLFSKSLDLSSEADRNSSDQSKYKESEKWIRLAVRFSGDEPQYLYQLGYVLQKQKKYDESLKYTKQSLKLDPINWGTKLTLGIIYIEMKRYEEARVVLADIAFSMPTNEAFYNLGLAQTGLKDYDAAATSFREAVRLNPENAESHYELGSILNKKGDKEGAYGQYHILKDMDDVLAEKLKEEANLFGSGQPAADSSVIRRQ